MKKKVMIGMSGGVDSSVAALLLLEQGYDVTGVTMKLRPDEYMSQSESGGCCSLDDIDDARRVSYKLGIDHFVLNFTDVFSKKVIDYFVNEYMNGITPNPCIACNKHVKFNAMLRQAMSLGFDYIATGHYSIINYDNVIKRWLLKKAPCSKDQSYVLYNMTQEQLSHTLMPLGRMDKSIVREIAVQHKLSVASKSDSQEICFVENRNYVGFIEKYTGQNFSPGKFIDINGNVLGMHNGIARYTIGQRKGLGVTFGKPMFVIDINIKDNTITLGEEGSQYFKGLFAEKLNFIPFDSLNKELIVTSRIRYQAKPCKATIKPISQNRIKVVFDEPQRSITKGQSIVFYDDDVVVGGGIITDIL